MRTYNKHEIALLFEDTDRFVELSEHIALKIQRDKYLVKCKRLKKERDKYKKETMKRKVKKSIVRWLNFYPNNYVGVHDTKDDAEAHRAYDRLGPAMRVEYEYEVEE